MPKSFSAYESMAQEEFTCPYCSRTMPLIREVHKRYKVGMNGMIGIDGEFDNTPETLLKEECVIQIDFMRCPSCKNHTITCKGYSNDLSEEHIEKMILPKSGAKKYPDYIPLPIRQDYEEAYAILNLSPKASATLSRRCLQGMIRDFWGTSKNRLVDEIEEIANQIRPEVRRAIHGLRKIGNIGAHMENDVNKIVEVEPLEAEKLIKLIELLMDDWYVKRHESELLCAEIDEIASSKKATVHS